MKQGLMAAFTDNLIHLFKKYSIPKDYRIIQDISKLTFESGWIYDAVWRSWSSKLDDSDLCFIQPDRYFALSLLTGRSYGYVALTIGDVDLFVLGLTSKRAGFGPYVDHRMMSRLNRYTATFGMTILIELKFAIMVQEDIVTHKQQFDLWKRAINKAENELKTHRDIFLAVSKEMGLHNPGHLLNRSRLVVVALAYSWYFEGDRNSDLMKTANELICACMSNEKYSLQSVHGIDYDMFFCDKICRNMHSCTTPVYENGGFDLISTDVMDSDLKNRWLAFKRKHSHLNLWKYVSNILHKYDICSDFPTSPQAV